MDHVAVGVGDDLDLDMPGVLDVPLEVDGAVAEGTLGLLAGATEALAQLVGVAGDGHAAATATGGRLDQAREEVEALSQ